MSQRVRTWESRGGESKKRERKRGRGREKKEIERERDTHRKRNDVQKGLFCGVKKNFTADEGLLKI